MKKILVLLMSFFIPLNVMAYSSKVIPGGETLGIEVNSKGILVIGFYKINGKFNKGNPEIKVGDYITKVNNISVNTINELTSIIEKNASDEAVIITFIRNNKEYETKLKLIMQDNIYKTGLYVKDTITGIGTLTYIDPESNIYGALGHEIIEANTNSIVEIKTGKIFKNTITSIDKSSDGNPGSKNAKFYYDKVYGTINKNTIYGIYGKYTIDKPEKELMEIAKPNDVKVGEATIKTVLKNNDVEEFKIYITSISENSKVKNIHFKLDDSNLIEKTGGIVQGMSGSPIIQNNKIIGAVTHVIIDNPLTGYGVFITSMLEEGEK